ncbi:transcription factor bHLH18-like [Jatropha curcas]|uniref:transcription factor bHLH18-like n=1 Tax=Jatropha curcas TaxID=180498 RepID=UPI0005FBA7AD|nr:transcription factor bHLH18-like [Jatropha curcas]
MLEEQAKKKIVESALLVNRPQPSVDEKFDNNLNHPLPEIEAKVLDQSVLVRIHCEKNKGNLAKVLHELEKLPLIVVATNILPFGSCTMDLTVIGQINTEVPIRAKDLVRYLRSALLNFRSDV